ncbi:hypothetical protein KTF36_17345 [Burkholderia gladioli]|uniref:hypothetical protein n=1 Tax=Burkholderia gladioli TaxID=28095 RepID=UPI001C244E1C|nr:hypothetical protein [Burkholderia gladioli]MBU9643617.1 hypothetical protein [Burkholderia gladioli]
MASENVTRSILSDGLLIAGGTALGYLTSYSYEYGYFDYFEIPPEFISTNTTTILAVVAAFLAMFGSTLNLLGFTAPLLRSAMKPEKDPYRYSLVFAFLGSTFLIFLRYAYGWTWKTTLFSILIFIIIGLLTHIPVLLPSRKNKKPLRERFVEHTKIQDSDPFLITSLFEIWFSRKTIILSILALGLLGLAYVLGNGAATKKDRFLTLDADPNKVVLRAYSDTLIIADVSRKEHKVSNRIEIMSLSEKKNIKFWNEKLGRLTYDDSKGKG